MSEASRTRSLSSHVDRSENEKHRSHCASADLSDSTHHHETARAKTGKNSLMVLRSFDHQKATPPKTPQVCWTRKRQEAFK